MATIDELRARAELISEEQQIGGNTAERVGEAFDMVADIEEAIDERVQDLEGLVGGRAVTYNPQTPTSEEQAQARENINAQESIADIDEIRAGAEAGATAYQLPQGGIPEADMAADVQAALAKARTAYQKPSAGIPYADLNTALKNQITEANDNDVIGFRYVQGNIYFYKPLTDGTFGTTSYDATDIIVKHHHNIALYDIANNLFYFPLSFDLSGAVKRYKYFRLDSSITFGFIELIRQGATPITSAYVAANVPMYTKAQVDTLLAGKQPTIADLDVIRSGAAEGATAYQKPANGIPASDMAQGVQDALQAAEDAAPQATTYTKTETDALLNQKQGTLTFDDAPSASSSNPVKSSGIYSALQTKQNSADIATINGSDITHGGNVTIVAAEGQTITIDAAPTAGSSNAVSSGGVYPLMLKTEQLGTITESILPNKEWINNTFGSSGGGSSTIIYFDTRNILSAGNRLKSVSLAARTANKSLIVRFVSVAARVVYPDAIECSPTVVGVNTFIMDKVFNEDVYVGVVSPEACIGIKSNSGSTTYRIDTSGTNYTHINYDLGMSIKTWAEYTPLKDEVSENKENIDEIRSMIGIGEKTPLPAAEWWSQSFDTKGLGADIQQVYFDTRCILPARHTLKKLMIDSNYEGDLRIYFLSSVYSVESYIDKPIQKGINTIELDYTNGDSPVYVGIASAGAFCGLSSSNNYSKRLALPAGTLYSVNFLLAYSIEIEQYSANGIITTLSQLKSALKRGGVITIGNANITIDEPLVLGSGVKIIGSRGESIITVPSSVLKCFEIRDVEDVTIENITVVGAYNGTPLKSGLQPVKSGIIDTAEDARSKANIGYQTDIVNGGVTSDYIPQIGVNIYNCEKVEILGCEIKNFSFYGLCIGHSGTNYRYACKFERNYINNCYCGIYTYNEAERSQYIANNISLCQIGLYTDSGTNMFAYNAYSANRIGMLMNNGWNQSHDVHNGNAYTHCSLFSIVSFDIEFGALFSQCKVGYNDSEPGNQSTYAGTWFKNSRGISFDNCQLIQAKVYIDGQFTQHGVSHSNGTTDIFGNTSYVVTYETITGAGVNKISNCQALNTCVISKTTDANVILKDNYYINGNNSSGLNNQ